MGNEITDWIDDVFNRLEAIQANHAFANFYIDSKEPNKWIISLMRYNEEDDYDADHESFYGTEQAVMLEAHMEAIGERLLSSYPLDNIKWGHFKFNYNNRSITSSVEFI